MCGSRRLLYHIAQVGQVRVALLSLVLEVGSPLVLPTASRPAVFGYVAALFVDVKLQSQSPSRGRVPVP